MLEWLLRLVGARVLAATVILYVALKLFAVSAPGHDDQWCGLSGLAGVHGERDRVSGNWLARLESIAVSGDLGGAVEGGVKLRYFSRCSSGWF